MKNMSAELNRMSPQYIVDKKGNKTAVILDIKTFEKIMEELEDVFFAARAHKNLQEATEYIPHEEVVTKNRKQKRK